MKTKLFNKCGSLHPVRDASLQDAKRLFRCGFLPRGASLRLANERGTDLRFKIDDLRFDTA